MLGNLHGLHFPNALSLPAYLPVHLRRVGKMTLPEKSQNQGA
jgi:hypothetical protein